MKNQIKIYNFTSPLNAILSNFNIEKSDLHKSREKGIQNLGIYYNSNRVYKISDSKKEFLAAKRIIGKKFNNVVSIYSAIECKICNYPSYILEEEKLCRNKDFNFTFLDIKEISKNITKNIPYFVSILNGITELSSVGIIHNDLHINNILFDTNNNPKIIDFGIVRLQQSYNKKPFSIKLKYL